MRCEQVTVFRDKHEVLNVPEFSLAPGEVLALLGPNGAGKTTLLQALSGELSLKTGTIYFDNKRRDTLPRQERAQRLAVLPQILSLPFPVSIADVVLIGRIPHKTSVAQNNRIAQECLKQVDICYAGERPYSHLSSGEQQRVQLARVLAQIATPVFGTRYLLLDEPTSALDLAHQHGVLRLLRTLAQKEGIGILVILHDLNLAMQYADRVMLLKNGQVVASGSPDAVLTPACIQTVFNLSITRIPHPSATSKYILVADEQAICYDA